MKVEIKKVGEQIIAKSEYHPDLPREAKKLGGRWNPERKAWVFDARDFDRVRKLYRNTYGTDGSDNGETVTIKAELTSEDEDFERCGGYYLGPVCIGRAFGRDSGAKLSSNIVCLQGGLTSGGSVKNWATVVRKGTVIEIRDLPKGTAQELLDNPPIFWETSAVDERIDREALVAERERLVARIAEIDKLL